MTRLKKYIYPFLTLFALAPATILTGCNDDLDFSVENAAPDYADGSFTIEIKCAEASTRATEAGDDTLNENLIKTATVCLWPNGGDWLSSNEPMYMETFTNINSVGSASLRIPVTEQMVSSLFGIDESRSCQVFVAVNVDPGTARTVDDLRALAISSSFDNRQKQDAFVMDGDGVAKMININGKTGALAQVEVSRAASKFTLHLNVEDEVKENVGDNQLIWNPDFNNIRVKINNGVKNSTLDPKADQVKSVDYYNTPDGLVYSFKEDKESADYPLIQSIPFYSYPNSWSGKVNGNESSTMTYLTLMVPWTSDGGESYRTCYYRVPVADLSKTEIVRNTSYHVRLRVGVLGSFVPDEPSEIENLSYGALDWGKENIDVDITEVRYLVVDQNNYEVNNEEEIGIQFYSSHPTEVVDAKMTFYRYNFSDQGSGFGVTVTNEQNNLSKTKTGKPVFTTNFDNSTKVLTVSHPLKVSTPKDANGNLVDLTNGDKKYEAPKDRAKTQTDAKIKAVTDKIRYYEGTNEDEYTKVEFTVTVQHSDMKGTSNFRETVTIVQYPAMYISSVPNYVAEGATSFNYTGGQGSTYINGNYTGFTGMDADLSGGRSDGWTTSIGLSTGNLNWNPNMYLITITRLPNGSKYHIGDPRADKINNKLTDASMGKENKTTWTGEKLSTGIKTTGFITAKDINGNSRSLTYYYPTKEDASSQKMLAPKFRVCSSYGGTGKILNRSLGRHRAAAYQEMGYAAGRWRLPTYSEIEFLMQLSADLKIPRLFGRSDGIEWHYWSAHGAVCVPGKAAPGQNIDPYLNPKVDNNSAERARFVYDEWYWGEETLKPLTNPGAGKPKYEFTWGDRPR
ncbi:MAG: hypothetical protein K2N05_04385 [Muribaculaceae bacterium]|nr:hypothetical protein [Muribaculaceae bacterium]